jgi:hypothetical protein
MPAANRATTAMTANLHLDASAAVLVMPKGLNVEQQYYKTHYAVWAPYDALWEGLPVAVQWIVAFVFPRGFWVATRYSGYASRSHR